MMSSSYAYQVWVHLKMEIQRQEHLNEGRINDYRNFIFLSLIGGGPKGTAKGAMATLVRIECPS